MRCHLIQGIFAKIIRLVAVLGLVMVLFVPFASAQEVDPNMSGTCTPHRQEQGPWDCSIPNGLRSKCSEGTMTGRDPIWKLVRTIDDADALLRSMYLNLEGPVKFAQWLTCQGIDTGVSNSTSSGSPGTGNRITIKFGFTTDKGPFEIPRNIYYLYLFKPYGANITVFTDEFGQISRIEHDYSFE